MMIKITTALLIIAGVTAFQALPARSEDDFFAMPLKIIGGGHINPTARPPFGGQFETARFGDDRSMSDDVATIRLGRTARQILTPSLIRQWIYRSGRLGPTSPNATIVAANKDETFGGGATASKTLNLGSQSRAPNSLRPGVILIDWSANNQLQHNENSVRAPQPSEPDAHRFAGRPQPNSDQKDLPALLGASAGAVAAAGVSAGSSTFPPYTAYGPNQLYPSATCGYPSEPPCY